MKNYLIKLEMTSKIFSELYKFREMMAERGIQVDYTTLIIWVYQYSP